MITIPILNFRGFLLTSIQVDLADQEVLDFQNDVLHKVAETEAKGILIDITAMSVVDSFMARVLNETAHMVLLLGAEVVICGMQPMVALALTEMGRELIGVETAFSLDQSMDKLEQLVAARQRVQ